MTNEQLALLMDGWLAELEVAIDEARDEMPEGAERVKHSSWQLKPEFVGTAYVLYVASHPVSDTHDKVETDGEYVALLPLTQLYDRWMARRADLVNGGTGE